ncbi:hypothetical protein GCM10011316_30620 [Roseibium aquae]|uniref:Uncharacterized protein n=1 Tax=Roseibium aquae TaxID=1323746 RepID=A0A916TLF6_9HYPH|nr:hypothetical protein [Roseibium aquae]GGB56378.1 hypothetical protein GCM10011316_30620 [Roseibium aquae]
MTSSKIDKNRIKALAEAGTLPRTGDDIAVVKAQLAAAVRQAIAKHEDRLASIRQEFEASRDNRAKQVASIKDAYLKQSVEH